MLSIVLNKIFNKLISFLEIDTLILFDLCTPSYTWLPENHTLHSIISLNMYYIVPLPAGHSFIGHQSILNKGLILYLSIKMITRV